MAVTEVRVDGVWLSSLAACGDLEWSTRWPGGCYEASWRMDLSAKAAPPVLRRGRLVELFVGPSRIWRGLLSEPERGDGWDLTATGSFREGDRYHALTAAGATTSTPDTAIDQAIVRGLPWTRVQSFSTTPVVDGDTTDALNTVTALNDTWADEAGVRWAVDPQGRVHHAADPTVPTWHMAPGSGAPSPSDADYATHVYGRYQRSSDLTYRTVIAADAVAAARYGRVEVPVDLTNRGPITTVRAQAIVDGILSKGKARLGWTDDLEPAWGELTTPGGVAADLRFVRAGQMVRLFGVTDPTKGAGMTVDFTIGQTSYAEGERLISLSPLDKDASNLTEAIERATRRAS